MQALITLPLGYLLLILIGCAGLGALIATLFVRQNQQQQAGLLREENARLGAQLAAERHNAADKLAVLERAREQLSDTFNALSSQALRHNNEEFLRLAQENLKQFQVQAQAQLQQKEQSIDNLVKPIQAALIKTEQQIQAMEQARKEAYGSLSKHLESMTLTQSQLQLETRNLVQALRRPEVRGQWGELTLKRLVELAGMVEHCDFFQQETVSGSDGAQRPDMIVRLPDSRDIVIDVKTPLDAYLSAMEAPDDISRRAALDRHARKVRERVRELATKAYWDQFKNAPDFVVLFIPGDQFLSAALDVDPQLLEDALRQKIILATPTSLVALLRAVGYGWRQQALAENAERIRELGAELYKRIATFTEHLARLGRQLEGGVDSYNKAVGSLERQLLPSARRFVELGITPHKELETQRPIEIPLRKLEVE
ncbi:MAG: DNA recombination protein RmuC [Gammaproteobacteria bacterium]